MKRMLLWVATLIVLFSRVASGIDVEVPAWRLDFEKDAWLGYIEEGTWLGPLLYMSAQYSAGDQAGDPQWSIYLHSPERIWAECNLAASQSDEEISVEEIYQENLALGVKIQFGLASSSELKVDPQHLRFFLRDAQGHVYRDPVVSLAREKFPQKGHGRDMYLTAGWATFTGVQYTGLPEGPVEAFIEVNHSLPRLSAKFIPNSEMKIDLSLGELRIERTVTVETTEIGDGEPTP